MFVRIEWVRAELPQQTAKEFILRKIGSIEDRQQAELFGAYLAAQGITCSVDGDSNCVIWVQEEDRVAQAKDELTKFREDPSRERYRDVHRQAAAVERVRAKELAATRRRTVDLRDRWNRPTIDRGPVTFGMMALMVVVAVLTGLDPAKHPEFLLRMAFSPDGTLDAIKSGEVWRLVSPIFLHFGVLHFFFNLIALRDFGLMIEDRVGSLNYFGMLLLIAVLSNASQFAVTGGGTFGGMSGVNYGLFAYAWVRSKLDPQSGIWVHPTNVTYMVGWFVLCFFIPNIANGAHTGGLVIGAALGAARAVWRSLTGR